MCETQGWEQFWYGNLLGCSSSWGVQKLRLKAGQARLGTAAVFLSICVSEVWRQARLDQAIAPASMQENWATLQHLPAKAETVGRLCQVGSKHISMGMDQSRPIYSTHLAQARARMWC